MHIVAAIASGLILVAAGTVEGDKYGHERKTIPAEGAKEILVEGDFSAGEFNIKTDDIAEAAIVDISYNPRAVDYDVDWELSGSTLTVTMDSYTRRKSNIDTEDNKWDVTLSRRYPTSLDFEIGACDAEIDLGGLPLKELSLEVGAASGTITFPEVNRERCRQITIEAGASSLKMIDIGNANFDEFEFSGGVGSFELDFRGKYHGESTINIDVGLGSADLILPDDVPIRVETSGGHWFSSVDFHGEDLEEVDDDTYESPGFDKARDRIVLNVEVGMGAVDLRWKP
jgi:hypothetical protein